MPLFFLSLEEKIKSLVGEAKARISLCRQQVLFQLSIAVKHKIPKHNSLKEGHMICHILGYRDWSRA